MSIASPASGDIVRDKDIAESELHAVLARTWATPAGIIGALSTVDHKVVGRRYIVTALVFLVLGGVAALIMRLQLAVPNAGVVGPDFYNQLFSMHGTTMMFLFAVPVMEAFAVYLVPLMVGTRNIAFPRLNAFSYYVFALGGAMIWIAFFLNAGADTGWFSYVPLSGPEFSPGKRVDIWAQMITFTEVAALAVAVEIIVTVFKLRAPGMTLDRIPLFVWSQLVTSFTVLLAMPGVMLASSMLIMDRLVETHFFNPAEGGDALLWQHLFWWFGHPEVYIIFLPATGMVSEIIATFSRRETFGYIIIVLSLITIGFLSFGLWVHHMFVAGLPQLGASFFTAASMVIAIPSGLQIFCWIATLWGGQPVFKTPLLFVVGFILIFVIGGLSGVMLASVPIDTQVHDTYFVVAHFHYVLIGGAVFPLLGGIYYWFPKITGRMLSEEIGRIHFWLAFLSFNLAFFPMHFAGLAGMPRRVYTYGPEMAWDGYNLLSSIGALGFAASFLLLFWNAATSLRTGKAAGENPWNAASLEWATASPPPAYNFRYIPVVTSRSPLWSERDALPVAEGLAADRREILVSTVTGAQADIKETSPAPSFWPFLAAVATTIAFIGSIFTPWAVVWGGILVAITLIGWFWPKRVKEDEA
jgi:cytochrome c oxidase subunit 1